MCTQRRLKSDYASFVILSYIKVKGEISSEYI